LIAAAVAIAAGNASAAEKKLRSALVPEAMNNPYFDLSRDGCMGEPRHTASRSRSVAEAAVGVIKHARDAGIAVITFDAGSPKPARQAYVRTNNKGYDSHKVTLVMPDNGQKVPLISYVCLDVVTKDNAAQFLK
jgi:ribose transport system substrate-binding protein